MKQPSRRRALAALVTAAAVAAPATASAHPGVFEVTAKVVDPAFQGTTATEANLIDQRQYAVGNDGYTGVWRESNGVLGHGLIQYKAMPSAKGFRASFTAQEKLHYAPAQTDLQTHATCTTPALTSDEAILAWQDDTDPFFNYVPFQKTTAILGDEPTDWIPVVLAETGVDLNALSTPAEFQAACEGLPGPGVYHPADAVVTTGAGLASALIAAAVSPVQAMVTALTGEKSVLLDQISVLNTQVTGLTADKTGLTGQVTALNASKTTLEDQVAALKAQVERLEAAATTLRIAALGSSTVTGVAAGGISVRLTGPPSAVATVRMVISETLAKKLGLRTRILATSQATIGADRSTTVVLKPGTAAAQGMRRSRGGFRISVEARSGDRYALAVTKLAK